jgi:hypothetical protein
MKKIELIIRYKMADFSFWRLGFEDESFWGKCGNRGLLITFVFIFCIIRQAVNNAPKVRLLMMGLSRATG